MLRNAFFSRLLPLSGKFGYRIGKALNIMSSGRNGRAVKLKLIREMRYTVSCSIAITMFHTTAA